MGGKCGRESAGIPNIYIARTEKIAQEKFFFRGDEKKLVFSGN
jgi:hypothetical protein